MDTLHRLIPVLIQGLTEFLPVSGTAQLRLAGAAATPDAAARAAVPLGSLVAVMLYLRHDLAAMAGGWLQARKSRIPNDDSRLVLAVSLGCLPWILASLLAGQVAARLDTMRFVAAAALTFAVAIGWADARGPQLRCEYRIRWEDVALIACAQVLALLPGVPRAGIAMAAGRSTGLDRKAAARFAFLLSIPALMLETGRALLAPGGPVRTSTFWSASTDAAVAAVGGLLAIAVLMKSLNAFGVRPFVVYQIAVGVALLLGVQ